MDLLKSPREEVRATSVCALGAMCNPEAMKSLEDLLSDCSLVNIYHPKRKIFTATTVSDLAKQVVEKTKNAFHHQECK
jgi:HEAT repeat protein